MFLLSTMSVDVPYWQVTLYMVIAGLGVGPGLPLYTLAIQNAIDVRKVGQATSAAQFFRQIGGAVGAAVMGTILATTLTGAFGALAGSAALEGVDAPAIQGGELASTGGSDIGTTIREAFAAQADALVAALESPDPQALPDALAASAVPAQARGFILGAAAAARGDEAATAALAGQLQRAAGGAGRRGRGQRRGRGASGVRRRGDRDLPGADVGRGRRVGRHAVRAVARAPADERARPVAVE